METLRFHERRGLLASPARLSSGYREYPQEAVRVVRFIKYGQDLGFTLEDITGLLALAAVGPDGCDTFRDLAGTKIDTVNDKVTRLVANRDALTQLVVTRPSTPSAQPSRPRITKPGYGAILTALDQLANALATTGNGQEDH